MKVLMEHCIRGYVSDEMVNFGIPSLCLSILFGMSAMPSAACSPQSMATLGAQAWPGGQDLSGQDCHIRRHWHR